MASDIALWALGTGIFIWCIWAALSAMRSRPSFITRFGTYVWDGGFPVGAEEFESIQQAILETYPSVEPSWTPEAIRVCFYGLHVRFEPFPIRDNDRGFASGSTDPETGNLCRIAYVSPICDSEFAHEFIHVLAIKIDKVSYDDDIAHRGWVQRGYYIAVNAVKARVR